MDPFRRRHDDSFRIRLTIDASLADDIEREATHRDTNVIEVIYRRLRKKEKTPHIRQYSCCTHCESGCGPDGHHEDDPCDVEGCPGAVPLKETAHERG